MPRDHTDAFAQLPSLPIELESSERGRLRMNPFHAPPTAVEERYRRHSEGEASAASCPARIQAFYAAHSGRGRRGAEMRRRQEVHAGLAPAQGLAGLSRRSALEGPAQTTVSDHDDRPQRPHGTDPSTRREVGMLIRGRPGHSGGADRDAPEGETALDWFARLVNSHAQGDGIIASEARDRLIGSGDAGDRRRARRPKGGGR